MKGEAFWGSDQRTPIVRAPADPWAGRTHEVPMVRREAVRPGRKAYGRIYQTLLAGATHESDTYVGKTTGTIHARIYGKSDSAHTSAKSVAKDPWKARILPAPHGGRLLETVYASGDPAEDDRNLRRAEAYWIQRLGAVHNQVLPIKPIDWQPQSRPARPARRKPLNLKPWLLLLVVALFTWLAARVVGGADLPPAAPWIASPVVGLLAGWPTFWWLHRACRKLMR